MVFTQLRCINCVLWCVSALGFGLAPASAHAAYHFADFRARPPIHIYKSTGKHPSGITPSEIKQLYGLPETGGHGSVVLITAYGNPSLEADLATFDTAFSLPACTMRNGCLTVHALGTNKKTRAGNSGWAMETALDAEWAHAIAPEAHLVIAVAPTPSGVNLLKAVDYAASIPDATAISMSWGGPETPEEVTLDAHFESASGATFFAASGDSGAGTSWPAASPQVVAVGGTSLVRRSNAGSGESSFTERAWEGSGGGLSAYEVAPAYQRVYRVPRAFGMRAVPDVAYDADPASGFPVFHAGVWHTVGGTSAGAPQWAAIAALGTNVRNESFYADKASTKYAQYFNDIVSGSNGDCGYYCSARAHYDYVTGLGTPRTSSF